MAFSELGIELNFKGEGINEVATVAVCSGDYTVPVGQVVVKVDPRYFRPTEVDLLIGDASKAFNKLGWKPTYTLAELVKEMVASDVKSFTKHQILRAHGFEYTNEYE
jgi:GDPmannose 4,6-dehydratase